MKSGPGHKALRRGRYSQSGSTYFITVCTFRRQKLLRKPGIPELIFNELARRDVQMQLRASIVMEDHIHFVAALDERTLGAAIGAFKGASSRAINKHLERSGALWQRGFFDHKFRSDEDMAPILHYMWNNPRTPGDKFRCNKEDWLWFKSIVSADVEYPQWLRLNPMG